MSSLVKFSNRKDGNGRGNVYWNRSEIDGLPFRGASAPLLKEEEYADRVVRVNDFKNATFDTSNPEQNAEYCRVMDSVANSWFNLIHIDRHRKPDDNGYLIYMEWVEPFLEDGKPNLSFGV
jgi:hypothetical protein